MVLEIKKQDRENSQNLVRRFSRRMKQSGILMEARSSRFRKRGKSENMKKKSALRREELKKQYQLEEKLSKPKVKFSRYSR
jgi:ribosomal protein S21